MQYRAEKTEEVENRMEVFLLASNPIENGTYRVRDTASEQQDHAGPLNRCD